MLPGSPPHTWRILKNDKFTTGETRITSTYVENTGKVNIKPIYGWDHLHIRGEYNFKAEKSYWPIGSPPHTWRILAFANSEAEWIRITSTYVENTIISKYHTRNI